MLDYQFALLTTARSVHYFHAESKLWILITPRGCISYECSHMESSGGPVAHAFT